MTNNDELLGNIGKLLEAEREHTKKVIREEIAVEAKRLTGAQAISFNHVDVSLERIENRVKDSEISNTRQENDLQEIKQAQAEHKTVLEAVAAGQKELQETVATRADILDVGIKIDKMKKRIDTLEEDAGVTHKN